MLVASSSPSHTGRTLQLHPRTSCVWTSSGLQTGLPPALGPFLRKRSRDPVPPRIPQNKSSQTKEDLSSGGERLGAFSRMSSRCQCCSRNDTLPCPPCASALFSRPSSVEKKKKRLPSDKPPGNMVAFFFSPSLKKPAHTIVILLLVSI